MPLERYARTVTMLAVVQPDPCCPAGRCRFRPGTLYYLLRRYELAGGTRGLIDLRSVIRDVMTEWEGETALAERASRGSRTHSDNAHDMAIDILRACAELRCKPTRANAGRLARHLCPFAEMDEG